MTQGAASEAKLEYRPIRHGEFPTPQDFFDAVAAKWGPFDLDAAATSENAKCGTYWTKDDNGLMQPWFGTVWVNPPYGRNLKQWLSKAVVEVRSGRVDRVVMLLPSRTDTIWWHRHVMLASQHVVVVKGRLKFEGYESGGMFPSVLVVFERGGASPRFYSMDSKTGETLEVTRR